MGADAPVSGVLVTGPKPVAQIVMYSHLLAGRAGAEKSVIGPGTKAKHLTYLGDTTIGAGANIGAGTITANYDGTHKHPTVIDDGAFIGSGTVLVAPSRVGRGGITGAGAIVTRNTTVGDGEVFVGVPAKKLQKPRKEEQS